MGRPGAFKPEFCPFRQTAVVLSREEQIQRRRRQDVPFFFPLSLFHIVDQDCATCTPMTFASSCISFSFRIIKDNGRRLASEQANRYSRDNDCRDGAGNGAPRQIPRPAGSSRRLLKIKVEFFAVYAPSSQPHYPNRTLIEVPVPLPLEKRDFH